MVYRDFTDEEGVAWQAWEARPLVVDRRLLRDRRAVDRVTPERRTLDVPRFLPGADLRRGWLVFRSTFDRRRRSAIPEHWEELTDDGLRAVLRATDVTGPTRQSLA
jgi:hypothetical protein